MPRYRIHRSPGDDDDDSERVVSFDLRDTPKKERKGLFSRFRASKAEAAPWEIDTEIAPAIPQSQHDRNVPTAPRLQRLGSKARLRGVTGEVSAIPSVGRLRSKDRISAISTDHTNTDTDDPWAASAGGDGYDAEATLAPPPAPVPPDPIPQSLESERSELKFNEGPSQNFGSDSFWGELKQGEEEAPKETRGGATFTPPKFDGETAFRLAAVDDPADDFLGASSGFDMDVGFTHDSVIDESGLSGWEDTPAPLGLAEEALASHDVFAPARSASRPVEAPRGHDMSYPDIPALTVEEAIRRGKELLESGQAEDALAILDMGLRMEPENASLQIWVAFAEDRVLTGILPDARADRVLRLVASEPPSFADPRDSALARSVASPRSFTALRGEHSGMSMREFAGRIGAMLAMRVMSWDD
jgi:hypothetical protein